MAGEPSPVTKYLTPAQPQIAGGTDSVYVLHCLMYYNSNTENTDNLQMKVMIFVYSS